MSCSWEAPPPNRRRRQVEVLPVGIPVELSTKIAEGVGIKWSSMLKHPKAKGKGWLIEKMLSVPSCTTPRPLPPAPSHAHSTLAPAVIIPPLLAYIWNESSDWHKVRIQCGMRAHSAAHTVG